VEQICQKELSKDQFRADKEDSQYIDNWVGQYDLLCQSKQTLGFIGACYFIGVIIASSIIPVGLLSDTYGRKWIFIGSMLIEICGCYLLLIGRHIYILYTCMILLGTAHPGRCIVGLSYADEFLHRK